MTPTGGDLDEVLVSDLELWRDGPPHTLFGRLRSECPVHWTGGIPGYPGESGYWSVTRPEDIHTVSRRRADLFVRAPPASHRSACSRSS